MKRTQFGMVLLMGISPLVLRAAEPSTQPAADRADVFVPTGDPADGSAGPNGVGGEVVPGQNDNRRAGRGPRIQQTLTDKEVADAMQFMSQHSPKRFDAIESLPDGEKKTEIKNFATRAYLNWMRMGNDPGQSELYAVVLQRVQLEDQIFGKVTLLKKETDSDKQKSMTDDLKSDIGRLVDLGLAERKLRLARLAETVAKEQKQLEKDSANKSVLVDERLKGILNSSGGLVPSTGLGGGGEKRGRGAGRP